MRDRSGGGRGRGRDGDRPSTATAFAQKSYRAALERAFESGKLAELAKTLSRPDVPVPGPSAPPAPAPTATNGTTAAPGDDAATPAPGANGAAPAPAPPAAAPAAPAPNPEREQRLKLLAKIRDAEGKDPVSRAVDAFLAKYPKLPDDFEILTKALAHRDDDVVRATLAQLGALLSREKPRRGRTLVGQLRFLEETHGDPEIRRIAADVRAKV